MGHSNLSIVVKFVVYSIIFGSDRIQYSKLLEMMTILNFKYLTILAYVMSEKAPKILINAQ